MKRTLLTMALASAVTVTSVHAKENAWEKEASDAWIDGKAEATLLFNTNLDSFDINTDVHNGVVVLTGKVEHNVDKKLAEELVTGIDDVKDVDNRISLVKDVDHKTLEKERGMDESSFTDAKIATVIKTRLLFDTDISGTDIDVDVKNGKVTLTGDVDSESEKQLAIAIAKNADDVKHVDDNLRIDKES
ncbi:BON domain-containing protein [Pseudoalteromonas sp. JBTF-M23]|uniref:BON domain-containing protein n=1 Tax=Pseudoalteromonas caenipelagi TaxID=2726988 RepID=A0A849VHM1_9GAMM|nr:BON domain-containing protein [Pseudoalteromonas caenipelagi]NOU51177.1 BON domain-containing protein [Pseudoalteromonas caenipelagi]